MTHNFFDIETTGLNPKTDKIISIQYQKLDQFKGYPIGPLKIFTIWEEGTENNLISKVVPLLMDSNPFSFVPVGNNLVFDFKFIAEKLKQHTNSDVDTLYFLNRPHIDLKHVLILINGGNFRGYQHILGKTNDGSKVPHWYSLQEYDKILNYVKNEATSFTKMCSKLQQLLPNLFSRRLDEFV